MILRLNKYIVKKAAKLYFQEFYPEYGDPVDCILTDYFLFWKMHKASCLKITELFLPPLSLPITTISSSTGEMPTMDDVDLYCLRSVPVSFLSSFFL